MDTSFEFQFWTQILNFEFNFWISILKFNFELKFFIQFSILDQHDQWNFSKFWVAILKLLPQIPIPKKTWSKKFHKNLPRRGRIKRCAAFYVNASQMVKYFSLHFRSHLKTGCQKFSRWGALFLRKLSTIFIHCIKYVYSR